MILSTPLVRACVNSSAVVTVAVVSAKTSDIGANIVAANVAPVAAAVKTTALPFFEKFPIFPNPLLNSNSKIKLHN